MEVLSRQLSFTSSRLSEGFSVMGCFNLPRLLIEFATDRGTSTTASRVNRSVH
jgi:hypothetical protein